MKNLFLNNSRPLALAALGLLVAGCTSSGVKNPSGIGVTEMRADERGFVAGTGVESQDIVAVTDRMARSILNVPEIANAQNAPTVILYPVENNTRFPVNKDLFLSRIRAQLNSKAQGKVRFVIRSAAAQADPRMAALERERELKETGQVTGDPMRDTPGVSQFRGADFILTGKLEGQSHRSARGTSDYILYTFQLVDVRTSAIVWEDMAEMKKQGLEDAAYR
ncbi:MAG: penicillin-binding protein activator LpoB [Verrucomicrobia bacterium]|nr:penicillin-binding protein activator LpoB [Verrucomicrobiota bacterium]